MPPRGREFPRRFILRGAPKRFAWKPRNLSAALYTMQARNKLDAGRGDEHIEWRVAEVRVN